MDCIDQFLQDIHAQHFYDGTLINPTRFFMLAAMLNSGALLGRYSKRQIETTVYRYYADNQSLASRHPRSEIRNITQYGSSVIKEELKLALETWQQEATQGFLTADLTSIYLHIDENTDYRRDVDYLWMVIEELFKKTYHLDFPRISPIEGADTDLVQFGQGAYRNHLMEEVQYCVCCDAYNLKKLHAIHILPDAWSDDPASRESIGNGLLMCYEHAQEYLHKRFYFDRNGRIVNVSSSLVHKHMRLSQKLLTGERKSYLAAYASKLTD